MKLNSDLWGVTYTLLVSGIFNNFFGVSNAIFSERSDESTSTTSSPSTSNLLLASAVITFSTSSAASEALGATTMSASLTNTDDPNDLVTTSISSYTSSGTNSATASSSPDATFPECSASLVGKFPPFCEPLNGSTKWVGASYYVTWDVISFSSNVSVTVELDYLNATGPAPQHAWSSPPTPKNLGYVIMTIDADWLQGQSMNNLTLTLISLDPTINQPAAKAPGPIISIINKPPTHYAPPPNTLINKLGLEVGIPVGLGAMVFIICALWWGMRKTRIQLGSVMSYKKGYGIGKSRRQRLGKNRSLQLQETAFRPPSPDFRDEPTHVMDPAQSSASHNRNESLGSLVSSQGGETPDEEQNRHQGNAFREEMARQQTRR